MPNDLPSAKDLPVPGKRDEFPFDIERLFIGREFRWPFWSSYGRIRNQLEASLKTDMGEMI